MFALLPAPLFVSCRYSYPYTGQYSYPYTGQYSYP